MATRLGDTQPAATQGDNLELNLQVMKVVVTWCDLEGKKSIWILGLVVEHSLFK